MVNLRNNGGLRGRVKDVCESQKGHHGEEVEDLFSEALEGRLDQLRGRGHGRQILAKIIKKTTAATTMLSMYQAFTI